MERADLDQLDWERLRGLRDGFLGGGAGRADYWRTDDDLALYDRFLGERIGWKWDAVITDLRRRGWAPPPGPWVDWGCGSGVAARRMLAAFPGACAELWLVDRSHRARAFAAERIGRDHPGLSVRIFGATEHPALDGATVLASHLLSEVPIELERSWQDRWSRATSVIAVEPGTFAESRRLIAYRERAREEGWRVIAPCVHEGPCGLLAPSSEMHWCHHFAPPPKGVGADAAWNRFARELGVDLRSLPYAFLVLDKRPPAHPPTAQGVAARVIGRLRAERTGAGFLSCERDGVRLRSLSKRRHKPVIRLLEKRRMGPLLDLTPEDGEIGGVRDLYPDLGDDSVAKD